jgi:hypothetical protein
MDGDAFECTKTKDTSTRVTVRARNLPAPPKRIAQLFACTDRILRETQDGMTSAQVDSESFPAAQA